MQKLAGKRALLTGAAQGIGFALASQLAKEGVQLLLTDTNTEALSGAERELGKFGFDCRAYPLDVTNIEQIHDLRDTLRAESIAIFPVPRDMTDHTFRKIASQDTITVVGTSTSSSAPVRAS